MYWESTYAHSMVHIIANISNFILYTGHVIPLTDYFKYFNPIFTTQNNLDECSNLIQLQNIEYKETTYF